MPAVSGTIARADDASPKNIIVMIADGSGANTLDATRFWNGEPLVMDGPDWTPLFQATSGLRSGRRPMPGVSALEQSPLHAYDPARLYDSTPVEGERGNYPNGFAGYEWHRRTAPDSAGTMSQMMTGVITYNGAINVDGMGRPVTSAAEYAHRSGKAVGAVSTVPYSHATPAAGGGAHNVDRGDYHAITAEILRSGVVDVYGGGGHPEFDNDGRPRETTYQCITEGDWQSLKLGMFNDDFGRHWTLVDDTDEIKALAEGDVPLPVMIVPKVAETLQARRKHELSNEAAPGDEAKSQGLPTLLDLVRAGLNGVDDDPDGFFLVIEGGAVDWAMHDNRLGRAIEEYSEFNDAVALVSAYLDAGTNGNDWSNTLVVVTADHDHLLFGPDGDTVPFQPLVDNGAGNMPGYRWFGNGHSNQLVPLFVRGAGAERIVEIATDDDKFDDGTHQFGRGKYLHQSELGQFLTGTLRNAE